MSRKNLPLQLHQRNQQQKPQNARLVFLPKDTAFLDEIIAWANANNIPSEQLPRDKKALWRLQQLDLKNNNLVEIPEAIGKLTNLTGLGLSSSQLSEIPEAIGKLTNLTVLFLSNNQLREIPEVIGKLNNLIGLNLGNNQLSEIPEDITKLANLMLLDLDNNQLSEIPETISKLTKLNHLGLINNQLKKLPESISKLTKLKELYLANNYLTEIPDCIRKMPNLKIIGLNEQLTNITEKTKMTYQQKILFGSPGTGKSHKIDNDKDGIILKELGITASENVIKTVFHPEYTYGDFIGKLVPITRSERVQYNFYEGHFLKALAQAYKNIIAAHDKQGNQTDEFKNVALVIDEINRGNSAAIFGTTFQLLDRNIDGWSSYCVNVNEITFTRLLELCDLEEHDKVKNKTTTYKCGDIVINIDILQKLLNFDLKNRTVKIPPNLSILASMNTSDSSIYYMDSAFKRRWDWEFIDIDGKSIAADGIAFANREQWIAFVSKLNTFIKNKHKYIRGIEDKQIGHYFFNIIADNRPIQKSSIQNKLMFFLWDSVFNRDKKPLIELLFANNEAETLITFGDFARKVDLFIEKIEEVTL